MGGTVDPVPRSLREVWRTTRDSIGGTVDLVLSRAAADAHVPHELESSSSPSVPTFVRLRENPAPLVPPATLLAARRVADGFNLCTLPTGNSCGLRPGV